ncbi:hypothetical protein MVES_002299 [Malassezia vespertilionis]|uniref:Uncharacterized protein n=2 Tax=Malassezia vespertilionis TaxID=2020962 RepID=A0A2N1JAM9_9BASI|nr:hypothetical protein MVES_002299 [Malassezia vespertilionis]
MTVFAEREGDRRARLQEVMMVQGSSTLKNIPQAADEDWSEDEEEFFTEGDAALLAARRRMAAFSLARAKRRIANQRVQAKIPMQQVAAARKAVLDPLKAYASLGSQVGGERPISVVRFSPDAQLLATGSWSGNAALWSVPDASQKATYVAHEDRVTGLAWHPRATIGQSSAAVNLGTGGGDGMVNLWSLDSEQPLRRMAGHEARVARIAFHPMGDYLASASFDGTWRLWDVESGQTLMVQEGHSREVYAVDFQCDGALLVSGGLDAIGRVWDTRTGRTAMVLDGHAREILSAVFAPNGYQIATASGDDTIRIWDMRKLSSIYTIPAHRSSVSDVRFYYAGNERAPVPPSWTSRTDPMDVESDTGARDADAPLHVNTAGLYLASSGYDGLVKVWSADDWQLTTSLSGDSGKVMSVDISADGKYLASGEWARTFKLWGDL